MSIRVRTFQDTPNPNAVKCLLSGRITDKPRSFFKAEDAAGDALGSRLFSIPGVVNVLIHSDWITLGKGVDADWRTIKSGLERVLNDLPV
jgi:hypothetical protein